MKQRGVFASLIVGLIAAIISVAAGAADTTQPAAKSETVARLTVRGDAELQRPADQLQLRAGVVTQAADAGQSVQDNSKMMNEVIAALTALGLKKEEYQTGRFQVRPVYSHRPRQPDPEWKPTITGYEVTNTIEIKTQKLEQAGPLLEALTKAGANNVESISFDLADKRKHRAEAISTATANAIADAQALAAASHQRLVRVLSITLDDARTNPPQPERAPARGMAMAEAAEMPPINPGDVTVRAAVTVVYEIAPQ